ncbi:hypothetical protein TNCV_4456621 [Trichonephila clavipes]|nr:hypothetical protein TNCV_4456621 [Trichonephila clavipes]
MIASSVDTRARVALKEPKSHMRLWSRPLPTTRGYPTSHAEVSRMECHLRYRPNHLTMVQIAGSIANRPGVAL